MRDAAQSPHRLDQFGARHVLREVPGGDELAGVLEARRFNAPVEACQAVVRRQLPVAAGNGKPERAGGGESARPRLCHRQATDVAAQRGGATVAARFDAVPAMGGHGIFETQYGIRHAQSQEPVLNGEREPAGASCDGLPRAMRRGRHDMARKSESGERRQPFQRGVGAGLDGLVASGVDAVQGRLHQLFQVPGAAPSVVAADEAHEIGAERRRIGGGFAVGFPAGHDAQPLPRRHRERIGIGDDGLRLHGKIGSAGLS